MNTIYVIQSLAFEDLGSFAQVLKSLNYQIEYLQLGVDQLDQALASTQPVIILGGPIGVYETENYPYLIDFTDALRQRLIQNYPTLGICLGAQFIAAALDAKVYKGQVKEIGWSPLILSDEGLVSPLKHLKDVAVLHWHGDTFDLPASAKGLAASVHYPNQAFSIGSNILALQFHAEVETKRFECWLLGHSAELGQAQIDILKLRQDNLHYGKVLEEKANLLLREWLTNLVAV